MHALITFPYPLLLHHLTSLTSPLFILPFVSLLCPCSFSSVCLNPHLAYILAHWSFSRLTSSHIVFFFSSPSLSSTCTPFSCVLTNPPCLCLGATGLLYHTTPSGLLWLWVLQLANEFFVSLSVVVPLFSVFHPFSWSHHWSVCISIQSSKGKDMVGNFAMLHSHKFDHLICQMSSEIGDSMTIVILVKK